jgi:hypothetical protein
MVEMSQALNRIPLNMTPDAYKTYRVLAPLHSHWRQATCEEIDCEAFIHGWKTTVDESTELGQQQAYFIRHDKTRSATEHRDGGLTTFTYTAGQRCFAWMNHKTRVGRLDLFVVDGGTYDENPVGIPRRMHTNGAFWAEDFAENQDNIASRIQRG